MSHHTERLRIGLLMDSREVPEWVAVLLTRLQGARYAELCFVVLNAQPSTTRRSFLFRLRNLRHALYYGYFKFDRALFKVQPDAFEERDVTALLRGVPVLNVRPRQDGFADYFEPGDVAALKSHRIDVFIRFGFRILKGDVLQTAKYGIWSYHHGDHRVNRGGPAGFWELCERQPVTGSTLQILTEDLDNGVILSKSYSATECVLLNRNRNRFYWKSLSMLPRKLEELHRLGPELFFQNVRAQNEPMSFYCRRLYRTPRNGEFLLFFLRHLTRYIAMKLKTFFFWEQWFLMYQFTDSPASSFCAFKRIVPPKDRFWADPFILTHEGRPYIFIEEFVFNRRKGHIAVMTLTRDGAEASRPVKVLERPYHLSSPFVFEWEGSCFMIPESDQNRTIEVYRCTRFPDVWELHDTLMSGIKAVDPVLLNHDGKWWLFVNVAENEGGSTLDELFIFYAESPLSRQWTPHPQNAVVSDVARSRPAGKIFRHAGKLYRPSQDCSRTYGYGVRMNEIVTLTTDTYQEREIGFIEPLWSPDLRGTHTFNFENGLVVIDGKRNRFKYF